MPSQLWESQTKLTSALRAQPGGAGREPEGPLFCLTTLLPTVDSLGISDELKDKLEDVLIPEQQFTLGRMLGKGVWGCVGDAGDKQGD